MQGEQGVQQPMPEKGCQHLLNIHAFIIIWTINFLTPIQMRCCAGDGQALAAAGTAPSRDEICQGEQLL